MSIGLNAPAAKDRRPGLQWRLGLALILFINVMVTNDGRSQPAERGFSRSAQEPSKPKPAEQNVHPYLEEPLKQLIKQIPELKHVQPTTDQQELPMILRKTGEKVDEFFNNAVDLIANEEIKQERMSVFGVAGGRKPIRDSYLIVRDKEGKEGTFNEYRMDEDGNRVDESGLRRGFLVTSGFALTSADFSPGYQPDSEFRYIGEEKIDGKDSYVVAFAQIPGKAVLTAVMSGPEGVAVELLRQGVAWVDKESFYIVRMRTDLLVRRPEIGLDEQTTKVKFSEVRLADVATPLWLPRDVSVYMRLGKSANRPFEEAFLNEHHYTNYRRYRVSTRMVAPQ